MGGEFDEGVEGDRVGAFAATGGAGRVEDFAFEGFERGDDAGGRFEGTADVDAAGAVVAVGPVAQRPLLMGRLVAGVFVAVRGGFDLRARIAQAPHAVDLSLLDQHGLGHGIGGGSSRDRFCLPTGELAGTDRGFGFG